MEDEGTLERREMGEEVEGRGGRASVGRATAIGRGKTRKIAGHPSITALPPRTGLAPFFDIPFSPIFALRTSVFTFLSSDLSLFFCSQASNARFRPRGLECARRRRRDNELLFPFRKCTELLAAFSNNSTSSFRLGSSISLSKCADDFKKMNKINSRCENF